MFLSRWPWSDMSRSPTGKLIMPSDLQPMSSYIYSMFCSNNSANSHINPVFCGWPWSDLLKSPTVKLIKSSDSRFESSYTCFKVTTPQTAVPPGRSPCRLQCLQAAVPPGCSSSWLQFLLAAAWREDTFFLQPATAWMYVHGLMQPAWRMLGEHALGSPSFKSDETVTNSNSWNT